MVKAGGGGEWNPPPGFTSAVADSLGMEIWYHIPRAGFIATHSKVPSARQSLVQSFQQNNNTYQAEWNAFTLTSDRVYNRKAKLYALLYDLLDQLSLEAGTRKEEPAAPGFFVVGSPVFSQPAMNQMMVVGQDKTVGTTTPVAAQLGKNAFQQAIQSGKISTETGAYVSEKQWKSNKISPKAAWAQEWDFEKTRQHVKKLLQVPTITQFSGNAVSNLNTQHYARLTLSWKADHPVGVSEYSFAIPDYSQPVQLGLVTPAPCCGYTSPEWTAIPHADDERPSYQRCYLILHRPADRLPDDEQRYSVAQGAGNPLSFRYTGYPLLHRSDQQLTLQPEVLSRSHLDPKARRLGLRIK